MVGLYKFIIILLHYNYLYRRQEQVNVNYKVKGPKYDTAAHA